MSKSLSDLKREAEEYREANPEKFLPYSAPLLLPAQWQCLERSINGADYLRRDGLRLILSAQVYDDGKQWLHVSISFASHLPSYADLREAKDIFIGKDKTAYQVFPDSAHHINIHPYVLHLWCCLSGPVTPDFTNGTGQI